MSPWKVGSHENGGCPFLSRENLTLGSHGVKSLLGVDILGADVETNMHVPLITEVLLEELEGK